MKTQTGTALASGVLALLMCGACHSSQGNPGSPTGTPNSGGVPSTGFSDGTLALHASIIDQGAIRWITPLGNLNPPGHTVPSDHIYFYFADPDAGESPTARRTNVLAPGDGTVTTVNGAVGTESRIYVRQTTTFTYYLDHVILGSGIASNARVTAGQVVGTTGTAYAVDLGVMNDSLTLFFANPSRYPPDTIHADGPLKYFDEPVRSQLYARVQRTGPDLDGKIDYDVSGRLVGNWFAADGGQIAFTYDTYNPSRVLISVGNGTLQGVFDILPADPLPRDVSASSGKVLYTLARTNSGPPRPNPATNSGYALVQMLDSTDIKVETFFFSTPPPTDFTSNARTFAR